MNIGKALKQIRESKSISKEEMAKELKEEFNYGKTMVDIIENTDFYLPLITSKYAEILNVPMSVVFLLAEDKLYIQDLLDCLEQFEVILENIKAQDSILMMQVKRTKEKFDMFIK